MTDASNSAPPRRSVWAYAEDSARWVFGEALGDPVADTILAALRVRIEMDRTQISGLFSRHVSASRIEQALGMLLTRNKVTRHEFATGGRPREVYRAA